MSYFLANDNAQQGPFELDELISRGLRPESMIWTDGMPEWKPASEVPEVAALLSEGATVATVAPAKGSPVLIDYRRAIPHAKPPGAGVAIASLVFGIIAVLVCWVPCVGAVPGIIAITLGLIARGKPQMQNGTRMAMGGILLGFINVGLVAIELLFLATK